MQKATIGGGCFWCIEAVFSDTVGVKRALSGYAGGTSTNPTYTQVCDGVGGHAEVVQISYDEDIIPYTKILEIFFKIHNPTTLNRQGNDIGIQYRSIILYHSDEQRQQATEYIKKISKEYDSKIVTQVVPYDTFYQAEAYHQQYYKNNPNQSYCSYIVRPKVEKFKTHFKEWVR